MDMLMIMLIALGLSMDAFAVSIAHGISTKRLPAVNALKMATSFGLFQAFMPALGWLAGLSWRGFISGVDHWAAFGLLSLIGCKMIYESVYAKPSIREPNSLSISALLILSIATSIDALAVGLSFAFLEVLITTPIMVIGTVTFLLSYAGVCFGNRLGRAFKNRIEIIGGLVLISIGVKILLEHLV